MSRDQSWCVQCERKTTEQIHTPARDRQRQKGGGGRERRERRPRVIETLDHTLIISSGAQTAETGRQVSLGRNVEMRDAHHKHRLPFTQTTASSVLLFCRQSASRCQSSGLPPLLRLQRHNLIFMPLRRQKKREKGREGEEQKAADPFFMKAGI